jgi:2-oxoisovalerate dehydrogenase E1 component
MPNTLMADQDNSDPEHSYLLDALRKMMEIRVFEQRVLDLSQTVPPQILGSTHLCAGREAVPIGAVAVPGERDQIVSTYKGHGWALAAGLPFDQVLHIVFAVAGWRIAWYRLRCSPFPD